MAKESHFRKGRRKKIAGKIYYQHYFYGWDKSLYAYDAAKLLRKKGRLARVVKDGDTYFVFSRKRRIPRKR